MPSIPHSEQLLAAILESVEDAVVGIALDGSIQLWSRGAEHLYGYTAAEVTGRSVAAILPIYEVPTLEAVLAKAQDGGPFDRGIAERLHKFGSRLSVAVKWSVTRDERGTVTGILESGRASADKTQGAPDKNHLQRLVEQMPLLLWTTDQHLRIMASSGAGLAHSETRVEDLIGRPVSEFLKCRGESINPMAHHYTALRGESVQFDYKYQDRMLEIHLEPLRSPSREIIGCIGVALDITQRMRSEEQIRYQATHDALTGLANYRQFMDTLERELRRAERSHHSFTIMLLDLDDLKRINDRQGHLAGNRALKRVAEVMRAQCRATDLVARYGGDEFGIVLIDSDQTMAQNVAQRIEAGVRNNQEEPPISVSLGIAVYPTDGRTAQDLLEAADQELYGRKRKAPNRNVTVG